jgi:DivIVA domain-containing protein
MDDKSAPATPQSLTDIQFKVSRKGYDPTEVDSFLERLGVAVRQMQEKLRQSTAALEAAERRASDSAQAQALLQTRITELEGAVASSPNGLAATPELEAEEAASLLAMARRTSDAVVDDARVAAAVLVAEAQTEASNIIRAAQEWADAGVGDLDARRQEIAADAAALEAFMDEQREMLSMGVSLIQSVLDDPHALRVGSPPEIRASFSPLGVEPVVPSSDFPTMAVTVVDLEAANDGDDEGSDDGLTSASADQLFGGEDDEADEAMRRFFDADFEDDDRFGR